MKLNITKLITKISNISVNILTHVTRRAIEGMIYSNLEEQEIVSNYLRLLNIDKGYCIDIAASDGVSMSNTYNLFKRGWHGLAIEYDSNKFSILSRIYNNFYNVNLAKIKVSPKNIVHLLEANTTPFDFDFLSLDIDGYDYYVLENILKKYRPKLICTEINEKIPPPIKFTVKWDEKYKWNFDHFYGQSISQLYTLVKLYNYSLIKLYYNNAFIIPSELLTNSMKSLNPEEAYRLGYFKKTDRKERFPWNDNMEQIHHLDPIKKLEYLNSFFSKYESKYEASIDNILY